MLPDIFEERHNLKKFLQEVATSFHISTPGIVKLIMQKLLSKLSEKESAVSDRKFNFKIDCRYLSNLRLNLFEIIKTINKYIESVCKGIQTINI